MLGKLETELKSLALESHPEASCGLFQIKYSETYRKASRGKETFHFSTPVCSGWAAFKIRLVRGYKMTYSNLAKEFDLNSKSVISSKRLCGK